MKINFLTTIFLLLNAFALPAQQWEWAIRPTYDSVVIHPNVAFVHDHGRWGVVDWEGHVLAEPQFEVLDYLSPDFVKFKKGTQWGVFSLRSGRVSAEAQFDELFFNPGSFHGAARRGEDWGVIDTAGRVLAPFRFRPFLRFGYPIKGWFTQNGAQYDTAYLPPPVTGEWPAFKPRPFVPKNSVLEPPTQPDRPPAKYTLSPLPKPLPEGDNGEFTKTSENPAPREEPYQLYYDGDNEHSVRLLNAARQPVYKGALASVKPLSYRLLLVRQTPDGPAALFDAPANQLVSDFVYETVMVYTPSTFYLFQRGGKWGLLSPDGREVEPPKFDYVHPYTYFVWLKNRDYGLLQNRRNEGFYFDGPCHDLVLQPNERGAWVLQNGRWGLAKFFWK